MANLRGTFRFVLAPCHHLCAKWWGNLPDAGLWVVYTEFFSTLLSKLVAFWVSWPRNTAEFLSWREGLFWFGRKIKSSCDGGGPYPISFPPQVMVYKDKKRWDSALLPKESYVSSYKSWKKGIWRGKEDDGYGMQSFESYGQTLSMKFLCRWIWSFRLADYCDIRNTSIWSCSQLLARS